MEVPIITKPETSCLSPKTISIGQLLSLRNHKVKAIDGLNIPNITIPPHLASKRRPTETTDNIRTDIRLLFNSFTLENSIAVREQLRVTVITKAKTTEMIEEIAKEILENFIISPQNIKNYMYLLNGVSTACLLVPEKVANSKTKNDPPPPPKTIGNCFLGNCRDMIFSCISEKNIRGIALLDPDDVDQLDKYNREREKIISLITTICCLYDQRNTKKLELTANQIYPLMSVILGTHNKIQNLLKELGNPYEDDAVCADENEYEILRKMATLYAEQLYTFLEKDLKAFVEDSVEVKGQLLKSLVSKIKHEVEPVLTEAYLISKFSSLGI